MKQPTHTPIINEHGQPIGWPLPGWTERAYPAPITMRGRLVTLVPLDAGKHAVDLFAAHSEDVDGRNWTYLPVGPFKRLPDFEAWCRRASESVDPQHYAIIDPASGKPVGSASYLRIDPANGAIEVGHIMLSPRLQRKPGATEAMYLMMRRVFVELGYRRYEWKCDALNAPSRRAAERLGFTFEGIFRQAVVTKGRNRDTAWYSITDGEWPVVKAAFEAWLSPDNFGADGRQLQRLEDIRNG